MFYKRYKKIFAYSNLLKTCNVLLGIITFICWFLYFALIPTEDADPLSIYYYFYKYIDVYFILLGAIIIFQEYFLHRNYVDK